MDVNRWMSIQSLAIASSDRVHPFLFLASLVSRQPSWPATASHGQPWPATASQCQPLLGSLLLAPRRSRRRRAGWKRPQATQREECGCPKERLSYSPLLHNKSESARRREACMAAWPVSNNRSRRRVSLVFFLLLVKF